MKKICHVNPNCKDARYCNPHGEHGKVTMKLKFAKPKKVSKTYLRTKADKLISLYVRKLGYCQIKGKDTVHCSTVLQDMHIVTRGTTPLRYDLTNHLCGCSGHHWYYTNNPKKWQALMEAYFPKRWAYIEAHENDTVKKTELLYREVIEKYSQEAL